MSAAVRRPIRSSNFARSGPTPLRNWTGVASRSAGDLWRLAAEGDVMGVLYAVGQRSVEDRRARGWPLHGGFVCLFANHGFLPESRATRRLVPPIVVSSVSYHDSHSGST